jgi:hypothetical protein
MYIESEIGKQMRYGDNAIDAFLTAVDNGQARLGLQILVDIVVAFADKIDELEAANQKEDVVVVEKIITPADVPAPVEVPKVEESKPLTKEEEVQSRNKVAPKEAATEK